MGEYVSTQTLVIHQWAGPSVIAQLVQVSERVKKKLESLYAIFLNHYVCTWNAYIRMMTVNREHTTYSCYS